MDEHLYGMEFNANEQIRQLHQLGPQLRRRKALQEPSRDRRPWHRLLQLLTGVRRIPQQGAAL